MKNYGKQSIPYRLFKRYLRFIHDKLFYRHTYSINKEAIAANDVPLLIVSNHQNCLQDPMAVLFTLRDRKAYFVTRGDIFSNPLGDRFLRAIGLLPAYRLRVEGEASLAKNAESFSILEKVLTAGGTLMIFPEAGSQDYHWLGEFSIAYLRLAFEAAEKENFKKDIVILPSCNHYSNYFFIQEDCLVKFGTPISLKPYYERYKTHPRTVQREINALVRSQIESLMLDIRDLENYQAIDFLRETYGKKYAVEHGYKPDYLPDKLISDKQFYADLEHIKDTDQEGIQQIYDDASRLEAALDKEWLKDENFTKEVASWELIIRILVLLIGLPIWLFSLWPNALNFIAPTVIMKKGNIKKKLFKSTFLFGCSAMVTIPFFYGLTFLLTGIYLKWWIALIYLCLLPALGLFAWYYRKFMIITVRAVIYKVKNRKGSLDQIRVLRSDIWQRLDTLLDNK